MKGEQNQIKATIKKKGSKERKVELQMKFYNENVPLRMVKELQTDQYYYHVISSLGIKTIGELMMFMYSRKCHVDLAEYISYCLDVDPADAYDTYDVSPMYIVTPEDEITSIRVFVRDVNWRDINTKGFWLKFTSSDNMENYEVIKPFELPDNFIKDLVDQIVSYYDGKKLFVSNRFNIVTALVRYLPRYPDEKGNYKKYGKWNGATPLRFFAPLHDNKTIYQVLMHQDIKNIEQLIHFINNDDKYNELFTHRDKDFIRYTLSTNPRDYYDRFELEIRDKYVTPKGKTVYPCRITNVNGYHFEVPRTEKLVFDIEINEEGRPIVKYEKLYALPVTHPADIAHFFEYFKLGKTDFNIEKFKTHFKIKNEDDKKKGKN